MKFLAFTLVILGLINVLRMAIFFILGDIYDIQRLRRQIEPKKSSAQKRLPLVSIIVPAYNEEKVILRTLRSLLKVRYPHFEVIVVDDGSSDTTYRKVDRFIHQKRYLKNLDRVKLIQQKNAGKANAINNALRIAKGSLVMTLDADSAIRSDALQNAVLYFEDKQVVGLASNIRIINTNSLLGLIQTMEYLMGHRLKKAFTIANMEYVVGGIGAIFRKNMLKKVDYFDTDTMTEDIDLTFKLIRLGNQTHRLIFAPDVVCYTEAPITIKSLYRQRLRWKYGRFQALYKNRQLFFNTHRKYSKTLTLFYLPFILFGELTFLLDPLFFLLVVWLSIQYHSSLTFISIFVFYAFYILVTIYSDEHLLFTDKVKLFLIAPLAYPFFTVVSFVEYFGLLKSILSMRGIVHARQHGISQWDHVERVGSD